MSTFPFSTLGASSAVSTLVIDAYASAVHYADHLAPIWTALEQRGRFFVASSTVAARARLRGVPDPVIGQPDGTKPVMVAAHRDELVCKGDIVLVEHGAGQHYGGHDASGMGAVRDRIVLYLGPNEETVSRMGAVAPNAVRVAVGSPKLDRWYGTVRREVAVPVVGVTWHWDARTWPESRWAFPHYRARLPLLSARWETIGHGHPRSFGHLISHYRRAGIRPEHDPYRFLDSIDLLVADNTSLIFEAAAVGIPVVLLDAPWYRRGVEHGLRFWQWADIGVRTGDPNSLVDAVAAGWELRDMFRPVREMMRDAVYGLWDGQASQRAAAAIARLA